MMWTGVIWLRISVTGLNGHGNSLVNGGLFLLAVYERSFFRYSAS